MKNLDAVIISGDYFQEVAGAEVRELARLSVDGYPATMEFLRHYCLGADCHEAAQKAHKARVERAPLTLNGFYLLQYLRKQGFRVEIVQFFTPEKDTLSALLEQRPRAVIISTTFLMFSPQVERIAAFVKECAPEVTVIAGGIGIWKSHKMRELFEKNLITDDIIESVLEDNYLLDLKRPSHADVLILSDRGEYTLAKLLAAIRSGSRYPMLDNTAFFLEGKWHVRPVRPEPGRFMEQKLDWSQLPVHLAKREIPVQSGTGCRFSCGYCDFFRLRRCHVRPMQSVIEELLSIPIENGTRKVFFTDDNLFLSFKHLKKFCTTLIERELSLEWRAFLRVDMINEESAELLYRSGCRECILGIESGDRDMLFRMHKTVAPEQILDGVRWLNEVGISSQSTLLIGFPGETEQSIRNTVDLLNSYPTKGPGLHFFYPFLFMVSPLAPVASCEARTKYQLRGYKDQWSHYTMDAKEAARAMLTICDSVKMDLSLLYHEERNPMWLTPERHKRLIYLRNKIHRIRRGLITGEPEASLWTEAGEILGSADGR